MRNTRPEQNVFRSPPINAHGQTRAVGPVGAMRGSDRIAIWHSRWDLTNALDKFKPFTPEHHIAAIKTVLVLGILLAVPASQAQYVKTLTLDCARCETKRPPAIPLETVKR